MKSIINVVCAISLLIASGTAFSESSGEVIPSSGERMLEIINGGGSSVPTWLGGEGMPETGRQGDAMAACTACEGVCWESEIRQLCCSCGFEECC